MSNHRYGISFLITTILFAILGYTFLFLYKNRVEAPKKKLSTSTIKIAIINPVEKKKVIEKKILPIKDIVIHKKHIAKKVVHKKRVIPKKHIAKKVVHKKRVIPKKHIVKKVVHKKRVVPKKHIVKKVVHKKRVIPKKHVVKKVVHKKRVVPKKHIVKKVVPQDIFIEKEQIVRRVEPPIIEEIYTPVNYSKPEKEQLRAIEIEKEPTPIYTAPKVETKVDIGESKRMFLSKIRSQIISNKRYPKKARRRHIEGSVKVRFDINEYGEVNNIRFINGKRIFQKSIRKTLERTFPVNIPSELQGELPISNISVTLNFNLI